MNTHRHLDEELSTLRRLLIDMAHFVDEQVGDAVIALGLCDAELAQCVRDRDDQVDEFEREVDRECARLLALQAPVAIDLRQVLTATKLNVALERVGDHAKNLAKAAQRMSGFEGLSRYTGVEKTALLAREIFHDAIDAFIKRDEALARQVLREDAQVDALYEQAFDEIVEMLRRYPEQAEGLAHLLLVARNVERIADQAKNIAQGVIFLVEGVNLRHRPLLNAKQDEP